MTISAEGAYSGSAGCCVGPDLGTIISRQHVNTSEERVEPFSLLSFQGISDEMFANISNLLPTIFRLSNPVYDMAKSPTKSPSSWNL